MAVLIIIVNVAFLAARLLFSLAAVEFPSTMHVCLSTSEMRVPVWFGVVLDVAGCFFGFIA